jgi:hypothetical protein
MRCPTCQRPMLALFTTCVCDHCDGEPEGEFYRAWVVRPSQVVGILKTWVFRRSADARTWRDNRGDGVVLAVLSDRPYTWARGRGPLKGLELHERPCEIYEDHRYPVGPSRTFYAPLGTPDGDKVMLHRRRAS